MEKVNESHLRSLLAGHVREGSLYEKIDDGWVRCFACGHRCRIAPGRDGICRVRFNEGGILKVPFGYVGGLAIDPVEKKPFFHALPGSSALSFGMLGCDYRCGYCQNWITSQALRDPDAVASIDDPHAITARGKHVIIIGGGPAGAAARTAGARAGEPDGHRGRLFHRRAFRNRRRRDSRIRRRDFHGRVHRPEHPHL